MSFDRIRKEPVAFVGVLNTLWLAILTLANVFNWWVWDDTQTAAVTAVWTALSGLATWLVRSNVSPTTALVPPVDEGRVEDALPPHP